MKATSPPPPAPAAFDYTALRWCGDYHSYNRPEPEKHPVLAIYYGEDGHVECLETFDATARGGHDGWGFDQLAHGSNCVHDGCTYGDYDPQAQTYGLPSSHYTRSALGIWGPARCRVWLNPALVRCVGRQGEMREHPEPDAQGNRWRHDPAAQVQPYPVVGEACGHVLLPEPLVLRESEPADSPDRWLPEIKHHADACHTVHCKVCGTVMLAESGYECNHVIWLDDPGAHFGCGATELGQTYEADVKESLRVLWDQLPPPVLEMLMVDLDGNMGEWGLSGHDLEEMDGEITMYGRPERAGWWDIRIEHLPKEARDGLVWLCSLDSDSKHARIMTRGWLAEYRLKTDWTLDAPPPWMKPGYAVVPQWAREQGLATAEEEES